MITNLFILFVSGIVSILTALLPLASNYPIPAEATEWTSYFHAGATFINFILPLDTIFFVFFLWLGIQGSLFAAWVFIYIYHVFRGRAE